MKPYILGICGGSGSGKTTMASRIVEALGQDRCKMIHQDSYYIDQSAKFDHDGGSVNFDHPDAIDFILLHQHLQDLKNEKPIEVPIYDFATHSRSAETNQIIPHNLIIIDGTLLLSRQEIIDSLDFSIYIQVPEEIRYNRRLIRDTKERGRTPEGVKAQFESQVKPMHDKFVLPSSKNANIIATHATFDEETINATRMLKEVL